ncbi:MAG: inositol monophosphatase [Verrucomicrobia bacterium]|nr:inositol monophosphatase [Verrucomicrobiota bacterium]
MNEPTHQQLLEVCIEAAKAAGAHALSNLHRRKEVVEQFDHDVKLVMDQECQRVAEEVIHSHFPDHAILGEEGATARDHAVEWIIDPIDGTANYARGLPTWCCSIAVRCDNKVLAGCVFVPVLNECYSASIDTQALLNGEPIHPSDVPILGKATLFTGLTKDIDERSISFLGDAARAACKVRIIGAAAIDICHVACGRSDGYFEAGIYIWDVAAAGLIAERAGAVISEWPRDEAYGVRHLCSTPAIHNDIKAIVEAHFGR